MKFQEMMVVSKAVADNRIDEVERLCQQALAADARDRVALGALAHIYAQNNQHDKALPLAVRVLEVVPDDFDGLRIAAYACQVRGDGEGAYQYALRLTRVGLAGPEKTLRRCALILKWFSWVPGVKALMEQTMRGQKAMQAAREKWVRWAQSYVAAVDSRVAAND